jgi:hypothetical protein
MKRAATISLLILFVFAASGCFLTDFFKKTLMIETASGSVKVAVEVADDDGERANGLMNRDSLADGNGMWFIFEDEALRSFWMKDTLVPLDIIFVDKDKEIVSIVEWMTPCEEAEDIACPRYPSYKPAMFALEVPAGFVKNNGVKVGDVVSD